jgi:hypothetical protein
VSDSPIAPARADTADSSTGARVHRGGDEEVVGTGEC